MLGQDGPASLPTERLIIKSDIRSEEERIGIYPLIIHYLDEQITHCLTGVTYQIRGSRGVCAEFEVDTFVHRPPQDARKLKTKGKRKKGTRPSLGDKYSLSCRV